MLHQFSTLVPAQPHTPLPDALKVGVGYIRVSSEKQADGYGPEVQREAVLALAAREGFTIPPDLLLEDHMRGGKPTRRGYQAALAAIREGRANAVFVFRMDRWGRDGGEWI